mmetsp:Transcript_16738/g.23039  ORF Transcript_16738/g.23039 Transcript_16738/m.23039 type:complete len:266 (-) Transcript_16738:156-953(-)
MNWSPPWRQGRPRRSGAARREQAVRAHARAVQQLLKGCEALEQHRGCQPSRLGAALAGLLRCPALPSVLGSRGQAEAGTEAKASTELPEEPDEPQSAAEPVLPMAKGAAPETPLVVEPRLRSQSPPRVERPRRASKVSGGGKRAKAKVDEPTSSAAAGQSCAPCGAQEAQSRTGAGAQQGGADAAEAALTGAFLKAMVEQIRGGVRDHELIAALALGAVEEKIQSEEMAVFLYNYSFEIIGELMQLLLLPDRGGGAVEGHDPDCV